MESFVIRNASLCHMAIVGRGRCMGGECKGDRKDRLGEGACFFLVLSTVWESMAQQHTNAPSHMPRVWIV